MNLIFTRNEKVLLGIKDVPKSFICADLNYEIDLLAAIEGCKPKDIRWQTEEDQNK